jgi:hypothetical protein
MTMTNAELSKQTIAAEMTYEKATKKQVRFFRSGRIGRRSHLRFQNRLRQAARQGPRDDRGARMIEPPDPADFCQDSIAEPFDHAGYAAAELRVIYPAETDPGALARSFGALGRRGRFTTSSD